MVDENDAIYSLSGSKEDFLNYLSSHGINEETDRYLTLSTCKTGDSTKRIILIAKKY